MDTGLLLGVIKMSWNYTTVMVAQLCENHSPVHVKMVYFYGMWLIS